MRARRADEALVCARCRAPPTALHPDPPHPAPPAPAGLASWFSLVPIPGPLQAQMLAGAGAAFGLGMLIERSARAAFPAEIPPEKGPMGGGRRRGASSQAAPRAKDD